MIITHQQDTIIAKITKADERYIYYTYLKDGKPINSMITMDLVKDFQKQDLGDLENSEKKGLKRKQYNAYKDTRVAIDLGFSNRIGKIDPSLSMSERDHIRGLLRGFHYGLDAQYFFSESYGIGLDINRFQSQNTSNLGFGQITEKNAITFIGPGFYSRSVSGNGNNAFLMGFNIGYLGANSSTMINSSPATITGGTFGTNIKVGYDIGMPDGYAFGFSLRLIGGVLNQITTRYNGQSNKIKLPEEDRENLSRIDLSVGIRF